MECWGGPGLSMEQRGGGEGARAQGAPTSKRCGLVGRWHSTDGPSSWKERTVVGGPGGGGTDSRLSGSEGELVIPDRIPLDWSLEFVCVCVCWGDFPQLSTPQP